MKCIKYFLLISSIIYCSNGYSQNIGFILGYSSEEAIIAGGQLIHGNLLYRISFSFKDANKKGKEVSEQKDNYGRTVAGTGIDLSHFDLSIGYYIFPKFNIAGELS